MHNDCTSSKTRVFPSGKAGKQQSILQGSLEKRAHPTAALAP